MNAADIFNGITFFVWSVAIWEAACFFKSRISKFLDRKVEATFKQALDKLHPIKIDFVSKTASFPPDLIGRTVVITYTKEASNG